MADPSQSPNPKISAYYQTRVAHHDIVTSDWLAQAQVVVCQNPDEQGPIVSEVEAKPGSTSSKPFSVIEEFNNWRKQPDLAEAVAAIRALAFVIRSSKATTMMELEIEPGEVPSSFVFSVKSEVCGDEAICGLEFMIWVLLPKV
ncbi:hypothetical protein L3X38_019632 [Prunus dulcis]|uniref:Uncharacterized protein n=1 Tax=Prunus dulcis TaxID=3755 RepID=A0AAD4ZCR8_PRUDU|nr:hypothetical protein L3X38_019632 [Prunus dulcis]